MIRCPKPKTTHLEALGKPEIGSEAVPFRVLRVSVHDRRRIREHTVSHPPVGPGHHLQRDSACLPLVSAPVPKGFLLWPKPRQGRNSRVRFSMPSPATSEIVEETACGAAKLGELVGNTEPQEKACARVGHPETGGHFECRAICKRPCHDGRYVMRRLMQTEVRMRS